eukprot:scaffold183712_cov48-Prasinocladus_malaysianus.AAC.2
MAQAVRWRKLRQKWYLVSFSLLCRHAARTYKPEVDDGGDQLVVLQRQQLQGGAEAEFTWQAGQLVVVRDKHLKLHQPGMPATPQQSKLNGR